MDTGRLLFFILMPLIYEAILIYIYSVEIDSFIDFKNPILAQVIFSIISLTIYYGIEIFYILKLKSIVGVSLLSKDYNQAEFEEFVFLSLLFIGIHLISFFADFIDFYDDIIPICHLFVLLILFSFFFLIESCHIKEDIKQERFDSLDYEIVENYTINLHSLSDGHTTSGDINGGRWYIKGVIEDNYNIYYSFINEQGSVVIRNLPYSEDTVDIFEEENCTNPRIEFFKFSKSYEDLCSEYYNYDIYIPSGSMDGVAIDMQ